MDVFILTLKALNQIIQIFAHLELCLATTIQNFELATITHICLIWDPTFVNLDVSTYISFPITVI